MLLFLVYIRIKYTNIYIDSYIGKIQINVNYNSQKRKEMYITVYIYIDKLLCIEKYNTRTYYTAI